MKTPEKELFIKLADTYRTALRELQQFMKDETLRRACGFQTLEEATRYIVPRALKTGENIIRQWEAENPEPEPEPELGFQRFRTLEEKLKESP